MAVVKPFICIRPNKEVVCSVAALPYDVYDRKEAKEAVKGKPLSFLNIDRPETQFDDSFDMYSDKAYQTARAMLDKEIRDGIYITDTKPCYYLYELTMDNRSQTGIVAISSIDDYINGIIKKHENTRAEKELDRIKHVDVCNAQTGPIFLAYRSNDELKNIIKEQKENAPLYDFTSDDGIGHRVWKIDEKAAISRIEEGFKNIPNTYIADGHHRAASAVKVGLKRRKENPSYRGDEPYNFFLSVLFPEDELRILAYNRAVKTLAGLTEQEFIDRIKTNFDVEQVDKPCEPTKKGEIGMYINKGWYLLCAKDGCKSIDPVDGLDVSILQKYALDPILNIKDPRTDDNISFIGGVRGIGELVRLVDSCGFKVAFAMYPTSMNELLSVADAGLLMPPKSTWFEPKLRSGIFIHRLG